ncbi:MAG: NAD-dependent epimerase/dehydratase family protein [Actinomycetota bacterium]|nr:NAD-dependent epimerase/dehydratase family protein [Actinomycetota bacterium]
MRESRVLITGGAGLVGSTLADQLVDLDVGEIVVVDNFARGRWENLASARASGRVTVVEGDVADRSLMATLMDGIDYVFHQAGIKIKQCAEDPAAAMHVMVDGSFCVVEAALKAGVQKVVVASTASVYGAAEVFPTDERHHPYGNRTLYGGTKVFLEQLLRSFNDVHGLPYVALRYFNIYGPRMDTYGAYTEVLSRWIERIEQGLPPLIHGAGTQTMDFVYVGDVARANILAAQSDVVDDVFNVASGTEVSLIELANLLLRVMGSDLVPEHGPDRGLPAVPRRLADTSRAADRLGFEAKVDLEDGLRRLVEWWRAEHVGPSDRPTTRSRAGHAAQTTSHVNS